jgi:hypothetical protein
MQPLPEEPGFGRLHNAEWIAAQHVDDEDGLLGDLLSSEEVHA